MYINELRQCRIISRTLTQIATRISSDKGFTNVAARACRSEFERVYEVAIHAVTNFLKRLDQLTQK